MWLSVQPWIATSSVSTTPTIKPLVDCEIICVKHFSQSPLAKWQLLTLSETESHAKEAQAQAEETSKC